mmetsp:Transcript_5628/g.6465  ORF Transcript_5628/g.6465 Transcript_5628/m.6465 type:complete len:81 (+) Transcript_5628:446-688(+)
MRSHLFKFYRTKPINYYTLLECGVRMECILICVQVCIYFLWRSVAVYSVQFVLAIQDQKEGDRLFIKIFHVPFSTTFGER